jgi:hypothetical protein
MKKLLLSFGVVFMAILGLNSVNAQIEKGAKIELTKKYMTMATSNMVASLIVLLNSKTQATSR